MKKLIFNENLLKIPPYIAGKSPEEVREDLGLDDVLKLASNENPLGPSPKALQAMRDSLSQLHRYPGVAERDLRRALARHHGRGLAEGHFLIGNGATDVLRIVVQGFLSAGGETVMPEATFPLYRLISTMFGARVRRVPLTSDYRIDLAAMAAALTPDTRVAWLCTPNNPTAQVIRQSEADRFMAQIEGQTLVVFDEAYGDYVTDPEGVRSLDYVLQERAVVIVRSFSKTAGLAGARIGYAIARPDIVEYLMRSVLPFNTGVPAIRAALASLDDHEYQRACHELVLSERAFLYEEIRKLGLKCLPSQANFVMLPGVPGGGEAFADRILRRGVVVRPMKTFGDESAIRVTLGTREQNLRFLSVLSEVLAEVGIPE